MVKNYLFFVCQPQKKVCIMCLYYVFSYLHVHTIRFESLWWLYFTFISGPFERKHTIIHIYIIWKNIFSSSESLLQNTEHYAEVMNCERVQKMLEFKLSRYVIIIYEKKCIDFQKISVDSFNTKIFFSLWTL